MRHMRLDLVADVPMIAMIGAVARLRDEREGSYSVP